MLRIRAVGKGEKLEAVALQDVMIVVGRMAKLDGEGTVADDCHLVGLPASAPGDAGLLTTENPHQAIVRQLGLLQHRHPEEASLQPPRDVVRGQLRRIQAQEPTRAALGRGPNRALRRRRARESKLGESRCRVSPQRPGLALRSLSRRGRGGGRDGRGWRCRHIYPRPKIGLLLSVYSEFSNRVSGELYPIWPPPPSSLRPPPPQGHNGLVVVAIGAGQRDPSRAQGRSTVAPPVSEELAAASRPLCSLSVSLYVSLSAGGGRLLPIFLSLASERKRALLREEERALLSLLQPCQALKVEATVDAILDDHHHDQLFFLPSLNSWLVKTSR
ncbi:hypothetical protein Taro_029163 [Colocasia esculenta]|uniref:Uncharacterized protein n=1 Tax=Colocasia esculenta TaxID=4460 RepID=A0A843VJ46_COLES|nr:hypothetical protein [Colocasia esculenta]